MILKVQFQLTFLVLLLLKFVKNLELGIVMNTCNPSYMGGRYRRTKVWVGPGQERETSSEKYSKEKKAGAWLKG
jgi:hypothetical protein